MPFNSNTIINETVHSAKLRTYCVGFDLGQYRLEPFTELIMDAIVDFSFGYHTGILHKYDRRILKEAARSIYKIKEYNEIKSVYVDDDGELSDCEVTIETKYLKRGEFGEMILHLILRDFFSSIPLLSKCHFKDTDSATVHGFDVIHIGPDPLVLGEETIFLGESKLYSRKDGNAGKHGVNDLIDDIRGHFQRDYLYREIALANKKRDAYIALDGYEDLNTIKDYEEFLERKKFWYDRLLQVEKQEVKLQDFFKSVTIPVICTYQSKIFDGTNDENSQEFIMAYNKETSELSEFFQQQLCAIETQVGEVVRTDLNIVLILFPVPSKKELVKTLHEKLYKHQC